ncbi:hypothetical protein LX36DRAFT_98331 [Colletotrichum falcatum]|nr:hypothetical protein LX36DRAFT_98331 [Colletotrichum falcatum]
MKMKMDPSWDSDYPTCLPRYLGKNPRYLGTKYRQASCLNRHVESAGAVLLPCLSVCCVSEEGPTPHGNRKLGRQSPLTSQSYHSSLHPACTRCDNVGRHGEPMLDHNAAAGTPVVNRSHAHNDRAPIVVFAVDTESAERLAKAAKTEWDDSPVTKTGFDSELRPERSGSWPVIGGLMLRFAMHTRGICFEYRGVYALPTAKPRSWSCQYCDYRLLLARCFGHRSPKL